MKSKGTYKLENIETKIASTLINIIAISVLSPLIILALIGEIRRLLCLLGFHDWHLESGEIRQGTTRQCRKCRRVEDDVNSDI